MPDVRMMLREMLARIAGPFFGVPFWYSLWVSPCAARSVIRMDDEFRNKSRPKRGLDSEDFFGGVKDAER